MSHITFDEFGKLAKDLFRSEAAGYDKIDAKLVDEYLMHDFDAESSIRGGYDIYSNDLYRGDLSDEANLRAALRSTVYNMWMLW